MTGGFDLAAEWMGWENMFHCEWNPFGQKVLNYYWPNAKSYGDITKTDFTEWRGKIDIVTGGFPCQPYSTAGKRKGKEDDRHLWPEMLRAIREIQPTWIVGENVPGLLNWERGMVLAEIKADLETEGFEVFPPVILPACGKNAPHRRDRLWVIAHSCSNGRARRTANEIDRLCGNDEGKPSQILQTNNIGIENIWIAPNSNCIRQQRQGWPINTSNTEEGGNWKEYRAFNDGGWPNESPIYRGDDGLSNRMDRIKALGNAIVPQVAYEIFKAIESMG